ncbi:hypothetical protein BU24DRAFT_31541 [Aaosphaeria arxii CBS 175.79]|uniref:Uncharacterized protein n=1 Tax=Aaosphaeria arxii CBS 175.79 TaxID=1450172 RepID=A0A6A5Y9E8_9PLEO|nr:uncharacterized protein BU24DRAFT_31541 [Aaosphaeria arxii CBS 175.79]KAF2021886.1 hypothetical protein BU24DRAFT_31541 [Aaosphaeria arxii CBS 175.79]
MFICFDSHKSWAQQGVFFLFLGKRNRSGCMGYRNGLLDWGYLSDFRGFGHNYGVFFGFWVLGSSFGFSTSNHFLAAIIHHRHQQSVKDGLEK